ncbi:hypothetical protein BK819_10965 [Microbacterium sp. LCT-H2]|nr:hypothetical protein BK819_10965 [Microbacterium sp. LCT-H2]
MADSAGERRSSRALANQPRSPFSPLAQRRSAWMKTRSRMREIIACDPGPRLRISASRRRSLTMIHSFSGAERGMCTTAGSAASS